MHRELNELVRQLNADLERERAATAGIARCAVSIYRHSQAISSEMGIMLSHIAGITPQGLEPPPPR